MSEGTNPRQSLGKLGERLALDFLRRKGYRIHETNFRCRFGELDIVASEGSVLVFVEVRARAGTNTGTAAESVTTRKQHKLRQVAEAYLQARYQQDAVEPRHAARRTGAARSAIDPPLPPSRPGEPPACRIDVVVLALGRSGRLESIELIRDAVSG